MRGLLVVNGFLHSAAFDKMYAALSEAADRAEITLDRTTNDALCPLDEGLFLRGYQFALFWDKDVRLARALEMRGLPVFNSAESIRLCDDKTLTWLALNRKVLMPDTILAPLTYGGYEDASFLTRVGERLTYPYVIKEGFGSFGQQVFLADTLEKAREILARIGGRPALFQRFIAESAGRDARLYVVGGKCVAAMKRVNHSGDFRANIAGGGMAERYAPSSEEIRVALDAARALGLTFAGVDLLFSKDGPLLCEVNSNAHFTALTELTGVCPADDIFAEVKRQCAAR